MSRTLQHLSHWGALEVTVEGDDVVAVAGHPDDPNPTPLIDNFLDGVRDESRIRRPSVRRGWLEHGPGPDGRRGMDDFVEVDWDDALDLVGAELRRVIDAHGNESIYGGSYGWASAGRFHHAQSQIHRFLNCLGGYTRSVNSYSDGAAEVIVPHVLGLAGLGEMFSRNTTWTAILEHTELLVAFGGISPKNTAVDSGGVINHRAATWAAEAARRRLHVELFSPLRTDLHAELDATWHAIVPGTDTAAMLALAHVLVTDDLHDPAFLDRYTVGADAFIAYVLGEEDGHPKTPEWAERIARIPAAALRDLARRMASSRTLVTVSYSLQRTLHGEQPVWMSIALAALLGQIGLPGGGWGHGYSSSTQSGAPRYAHPFPVVPQGRNAVETFIPSAQVVRLLENPGGTLDYDGRRLRLPDIRLVYWAGGNPFHHHQDLHRLRRAFARVDTLVVHDTHWTATARHADVVLPITVSLERDDIGATHSDGRLLAMPRALLPLAEARDDYEAFAGLAKRLDVWDDFTLGRGPDEWLRAIYDENRSVEQRRGVDMPTFDEFWAAGSFQYPLTSDGHTFLDRYRADPDARPLSTPSGRIELWSEEIAGFGYDDCPGHPVWREPVEWLGGERAQRFPLHLIANQPTSRLHSQLDAGAHSRASKVAGREPIRIHPEDAAARGIRDGDVVRVFNDRGACYAGAIVTDDVRPQVVNLSTGAWFDPVDPSDPMSPCAHGNPNVLTADVGTSRLAQGCTGQHVLVEIEQVDGDPPPVRAHRPPTFVADPRRPPT
jgi:biotin/methionine sulfoxide reductase